MTTGVNRIHDALSSVNVFVMLLITQQLDTILFSEHNSDRIPLVPKVLPRLSSFQQ